MRAFTVRQPWAHLIAHGGKTIENRTRNTTYRGPVAVHAGKTLAVAEAEWARRYLGRRAVPVDLVRGAVVAVAELVGCHGAEWPSACGTDACETWGEAGNGTWHWVLADIRPLDTPVPARGQLGLWTTNDFLTAAIEAALDKE